MTAHLREQWRVAAVDLPPVRFYHGTNTAALEKIRRSGFIKHVTMDEIVNEVSKNTGVPAEKLWAHPHMTFLVYRRDEDPEISLTRDEDRARAYADLGSEALAYTLSTVVEVLFHSTDPRAFKAEYMAKHNIKPIVLTIDIPWAWLRKNTIVAEWKGDTEEGLHATFIERTHIFHIRNPYSPLPASWIVGAR